MSEINNTNTSRQFLDYEGLKVFWTGIQQKLAAKSELTGLQGQFNELSGSFNELNNTTTNALADLLEIVQTLSPLSAETYSEALELSKTAKLGSVIYVSSIDTNEAYKNYQIGPYIVTSTGNLLYINTHKGDVDLDDVDLSTIMTTLGQIQDQISAFPGTYVTQSTLETTIASVNEQIEIVDAKTNSNKYRIVQTLPTSVEGEEGKLGPIEGMIYLVPVDDSNAIEGTRYNKYLCVNHQSLGIIYENLGCTDSKDDNISNPINIAASPISKLVNIFAGAYTQYVVGNI